MREGFKNNEKFKNLIENISDGIIALDTSWKFVYLNKAAGAILNHAPSQLIEKNIWEEFPESQGGKFYEAYHEAMQTQQSMVVEDYSNVLAKWTKAAVYPSLNGLTIYLQDITAERVAILQAQKSEANYRNFLERITDGFIVLDKEFRYVYVNKKVGELVQKEPESLLGKNVWEVFPEAVNSVTYKAFQTAFKEQRFISNTDFYDPLKLWQENYIYPSPDGLSIFIKDISDRKKLERELRNKERDQQFELMIAALEAQEKERTHIGQELHDNVNQLLVASKLMLTLMRDEPQRINQETLSKCINSIGKAIEENRRISHELVAPNLREQTLTEQLQLLVSSMLTSCNIKSSIEAAEFNERILDDPKKLAVYRIAQEQCTNIVKHAKARNVTISLAGNDQIFTMVIADDGIGMSKKKLAAGIGLKNIGARVGFFGGITHIRTQPKKGFELRVSLPAGITTPSHSLID